MVLRFQSLEVERTRKMVNAGGFYPYYVELEMEEKIV